MSNDKFTAATQAVENKNSEQIIHDYELAMNDIKVRAKSLLEYTTSPRPIDATRKAIMDREIKQIVEFVENATKYKQQVRSQDQTSPNIEFDLEI